MFKRIILTAKAQMFAMLCESMLHYNQAIYETILEILDKRDSVSASIHDFAHMVMRKVKDMDIPDDDLRLIYACCKRVDTMDENHLNFGPRDATDFLLMHKHEPVTVHRFIETSTGEEIDDFDVRRVTEVINDDETLMAVLDQMFMFDLTYDDGAWTITECVIL